MKNGPRGPFPLNYWCIEVGVYRVRFRKDASPRRPLKVLREWKEERSDRERKAGSKGRSEGREEGRETKEREGGRWKVGGWGGVLDSTCLDYISVGRATVVSRYGSRLKQEMIIKGELGVTSMSLTC